MSCSTCRSPNHLLTPDRRTSGSPFERPGSSHLLDPRGDRTRCVSRADHEGVTKRGRTLAAEHEQLDAGPGAHLPGAHVRVPDERARLRAAVRPAGGGRATPPHPRAPTPTSSCSTPARSGRTPTTGSTATSGHLRPVKDAHPGHADRRRRLPGAEGPRRDRPARPVGRRRLRHAQRRARCRRCWSAPGTTPRRRSRSSSRSRSSRRRCRPSGTPPTPAGSRSASAATTPARSASSRRCAARRRTAGPATSWPRCRRWSTRACSR